MKKVARRSAAAVILAAVLTIGLGYFVFMYVTEGKSWATYYANSHLSGAVQSSTVDVYDRNGLPLLTAADGKRAYSDDPGIRMSTLHTIGDLDGYIFSPALKVFSEELTGYNPFSGVSSRADSLTLSLDAGLCKIALSALKGAAGTVGVYNYKTGEILCMVSSPTYDPYSPPDLSESEVGYEGVYVNRFLSSAYVPGSVFKLVTAACAIDTIDDIFTQKFVCRGSLTLSGQKIVCNNVHGEIGFKTALAKSCNAAFAEIAVQLGSDILGDFVEDTGVCGGIGFQGLKTSSGNFDLNGANTGDLAWAGIGQYTNLVNPCTLMTFMGAIANGGEQRLPSLIAGMEGKKGEQLISPVTAGLLKEMMANNVTQSYGSSNFPGLKICAKSGTAEVGSGANPHAWFAGFLDDPNNPYAFVVISEHSGSGSEVAGSIANTVLQALVKS
ncbi:MAG: penicillin-binding protein [Clostridiales bacterium]|nr:penicillin-binding protein [Clostridiales bacterium]